MQITRYFSQEFEVFMDLKCNFKLKDCSIYTVVLERFWHKLNYFWFCQIFEILFVTCAELFVKLKLYKFQLSGLNNRH